MHRNRITASLALSAALALSAFGAVSAEDAMGHQADRITNNPTAETTGAELLTAENARLTRSEDGISISMKLVTPEAGSYKYPDTISAEQQAQPEAFTGWVFVFNNPDKCASFPDTAFPCGPDDFNDEVKFGAYNFSGVSNSLGQFSEGQLQLNPFTDGYVMLEGDIEVGKTQRPPVAEGTTSHPLENPMGAEVHVAIAPHGQLDPSTLPGELSSPVGNPTCDCWWVATFSGDI